MKNVLILGLVLLLSACHSLTYNTQLDGQSYIQFSGNFINSQVKIDDTEFTIDDQTETVAINGKTVAKFPISNGKHLIVVSKSQQVLVKKYIFSSEGQTVEVAIP